MRAARIIILNLFFMLLLHGTVHAQRLYPVSNSLIQDSFCTNVLNRKCGYKNKYNELVLPMVYCGCGGFNPGAQYGFLSQGNLDGIIDTFGKIIIPVKYQRITILTNDFFSARYIVTSDSSVIINNKGQEIIAGNFRDVYVNKKWNRVVLLPGKDSRNKITGTYQCHVYDTLFNKLFSIKADSIRNVQIVHLANNIKNVADAKFLIQVQQEFKSATGKPSWMYSIYNSNGKKIMDSAMVSYFDAGRLRLIKNIGLSDQAVAIVDTSFNEIFPYSRGYQQIVLSNFSSFYLITTDGKYWGMLDSNFKELIPTIYASVFVDTNQITCFKKMSKDMYFYKYRMDGTFIDSISGEEEINRRTAELKIKKEREAKERYTYRYGHVPGGLYMTQENSPYGKYGFMDSAATKFVVSPQFDAFQITKWFYFIVRKDVLDKNGRTIKELYGLYDKHGNQLAKTVYDKIEDKYFLDCFLLLKKNEPIPDLVVQEVE